MLQRMMSLSQDCSVVVVVDQGNHRLMLWRLGDGTLWKQLGSAGTELGQFDSPRAVVVTSTGGAGSLGRALRASSDRGGRRRVRAGPIEPDHEFWCGPLAAGGQSLWPSSVPWHQRDPLHGLLQRSFVGAVVVS